MGALVVLFDLSFLKVLPECAHWYVELAKKAIFVLTFSEGISIGGRVFRGVTSQKLHTERMLCQEAVESEWIYYSFFLA